jgi:Spo0E like sporulation regulatory protein
MPYNKTTVKRIPILENHLENSINLLKKELTHSIRVNGLSHPETLVISHKIENYIIEYQYIKLGLSRKRST